MKLILNLIKFTLMSSTTYRCSRTGCIIVAEFYRAERWGFWYLFSARIKGGEIITFRMKDFPPNWRWFFFITENAQKISSRFRANIYVEKRKIVFSSNISKCINENALICRRASFSFVRIVIIMFVPCFKRSFKFFSSTLKFQVSRWAII